MLIIFMPQSSNYSFNYKKNLKQDNYNLSDDLDLQLKDARKIFEANYLKSQLIRFKGNISRTSNFVGMDRSALHRKLKSLGIKGLN